MKRIVLLIGLLPCITTSAQKTITTYYDWEKKHAHEVYQVDANGVKNGTYRQYDETGFLIEQANYKFGKMNGEDIEYAKFSNYAGTPQTKSKITVVNDVKEGTAAYFDYQEDIGYYEVEGGSFHEDKENGDWVFIKPFFVVLSNEDFKSMKSNPLFKGSLGYKGKKHYTEGENTALSDGTYDYYYFPSGKLYEKFTFSHGKITGEDLTYFPDGKLWKKGMLDSNGKEMSFITYFYSGQIKQKETYNGSGYDHESYNEDGTPDATMKFNQTLALQLKENAIKSAKAPYINYRSQADNEYKGKQYSGALNDYQTTINYVQAHKDVWSPPQTSIDTINNRISELKSLLDKKVAQDQELSVQPGKIDSLYKIFSAKYCVAKESKFFVYNGKPVVTYSYPNGKHLFQKADTLCKSWDAEYQKKPDVDSKLLKGRNIIVLLKKLDDITSNEADNLDKQLKKAETLEDITKVFGF